MSGSGNDVDVVRVRPSEVSTPSANWRACQVGVSNTFLGVEYVQSRLDEQAQSAQDLFFRDARHRMADWRHVQRVLRRAHYTY